MEGNATDIVDCSDPGIPAPEKKPKGKRLSAIAETKDYSSGKASDVARNSAFACIAIIWIMTKEGRDPLGTFFLISLLSLITSLAIDFFQYVHGTYIWKKFYNEQYAIHECDDALIDVPPELTDKLYTYFFCKIVALTAGVIFLGMGVMSHLHVA